MSFRMQDVLLCMYERCASYAKHVCLVVVRFPVYRNLCVLFACAFSCVYA